MTRRGELFVYLPQCFFTGVTVELSVTQYSKMKHNAR